MRCETTWSRHLSTILGNNRPGRASTSMAYWKPSRNLVGFLLNDRMERPPQATAALTEAMWERREIENYLCQPETLLAWAEASAEETSPGPLFTPGQSAARRKLMDECIHELVPPLALRNPDDVWWRNVKASDGFLDRLLEMFFEKLNLPNLMRKTNSHQLASYVDAGRIAPEVSQKIGFHPRSRPTRPAAVLKSLHKSGCP